MAPKQVLVIHFGVISLDFEFQLSSSLNHSDMDKSFSSNFYHQEGSGATFKYPVMLGSSIQSFEHLEHLNLSIIDAIGYCSKIRKNVTDGELITQKRGETEKPITEVPLITIPMENRVEQANKVIGELMHKYIGNTIYLVICSLNLTICLDVDIIGPTHRKMKSARQMILM